jgi:uncharacterized protein YyaL (SSP411 family)
MPNFIIVVIFISFSIPAIAGKNKDKTMAEHQSKPNRLIHEKSPYLLQHAYNPVDWYPWGDEALEKARKEDKPILLSIGYSTCHWCHVMEEESFMNPDIAELMNAHFVCIKLDREERPDLDKIYMTAVTAITGSGGWPLNVFLTPDLKPFFGGTYFPPMPRQGSLAWPDILRLIANAWKDPSQRDKLQSFSSNLQNGISNALSWTSKDSTINTDVIDKALDAFSSRFDNHLGGFSPAPKFPSPSIQNFLFTYHFYAQNGGKKDKTALLMGNATLHLDGGFYSAEDADSLPSGKNLEDTNNKKTEGAFYVWEQKEIKDLLGDVPGEIFSYRYGVKLEGNAEMDPFNEFRGKNILFNAHSIDEVAKKFDMSKEDIETSLIQSKLKLLAVRSKRSRPLMISALSRSYQVLGEKRHLEAARNAAIFLRKNLYDDKTSTLFKRWRQGERKVVGMADDYAFLIQGLIDLYEADFDPGWIEWALELMDEQIKLFYDAENGGFFMTRKGHDKKIDLRIKEDTDSVIPSAGSVAVSNGLRLARFADSKGYSAIVEQTFGSILARIHSQPDSAPELLVALITSLTQPVEVIIAGERNTAETRSMLKTVNSLYYPGKIVMLVDNDTTQKRLAQYLPFIASVKKIDDKTTAYVCTDKTCKPPVTDPETVKSLLN